nr:hypothetical protein [Tanacetum cinerariifolium]
MIGKGFSRVDTPLFDGMLVKQHVQDVKDVAEDEDDDNEVYAEPTPPSPTPATQPSSPPPQQPLQTADISQYAMTLLNTLMETCVTLNKKVANLEQDKIAQAIEITKLKQRVKRLEKKIQIKSSGLKRLRKMLIRKDVDAKVVMDAKVQGRLAESQAK